MAADKASVRCCIAGGGPAGIMLGLLLARAGVDVLVLEKHADFLRDFRGDTIHPSTLEVMHELGLLEDLLKLPHQKAPRLNAKVGGLALTVADFTHLPTHCRFIAFMPQWDFLNFLADRGARYPTFTLRMQAEVTGLVEAMTQAGTLHAPQPTWRAASADNRPAAAGWPPLGSAVRGAKPVGIRGVVWRNRATAAGLPPCLGLFKRPLRDSEAALPVLT